MLEDVALLSRVAAKKMAGVLGDDLALNAQQVSGVAASRELPVVWAVPFCASRASRNWRIVNCAQTCRRSGAQGCACAARTDFFLSAEIIAITLGTVASSAFATQLLVLSGVAVLMTVGIYGVVAGIVKLVTTWAAGQLHRTPMQRA